MILPFLLGWNSRYPDNFRLGHIGSFSFLNDYHLWGYIHVFPVRVVVVRSAIVAQAASALVPSCPPASRPQQRPRPPSPGK